MKNFKKVIAVTASVLGLSATTLLFTNCADSSFTSVGSDVYDSQDPFYEYAWHLKNIGQKVFAKNAAKKDADINLGNLWGQGIDGRGVSILVSDDGVQDTHEDLVANFNYAAANSKDYAFGPVNARSAPPKRLSSDDHGTSVAGLIAATAMNGKGSAGVAPGALLSSYNFLSADVDGDPYDHEQFSSAFDIVNMSWGWGQSYLTPPEATNNAAMLAATSNGRSGKGTVLVKASGNSFIVERDSAGESLCVGSANFDADNTTPYTIIVGALAADGEAASYSSSGSNVWISSFGGLDGANNPAMLTTDLTGCTYGMAKSTASLPFNRGSNGNTNCNYTATFNGTSSAAPLLSGIVALMLQANPNLTWRDVKYILAKTAVPVDYSTTAAYSHPLAGTTHVTFPTQTLWEYPWINNAANFKFHNFYGFGKADATAAVTMAKSYTQYLSKTLTFSNVSGVVGNADIDAGDSAFSEVENTVSVPANITLEAVQLKLSVSGFTNINGLHLELEHVDTGTKSILVNAQTCLTSANFVSGGTQMVFLSNAFYRESSSGTWKLKIKNTKAQSGTLSNFSLTFSGD